MAKPALIDIFGDIEKLPHILAVDDDERLRSLLFRFLSEQGFLVTTAVDASDAREKLKHFQFDIVVMDVMMPGENGMELTQKLKSEGFKTPVLLLTALGEIESRIKGFEAGADDYLPKPFEPRELVLRINAILRRAASVPTNTAKKEIRLGKWRVDVERGELAAGDERQMLTQAEQLLLKALCSKVGEVVEREVLAEMCGLEASERTIDVQITRLRRKVEEDSKLPRYIQTVRGKGYILRPDEE